MATVVLVAKLKDAPKRPAANAVTHVVVAAAIEGVASATVAM